MIYQDEKLPTDHDEVLDRIAETLDIPPPLQDEAVERYESLGRWLDRDGSSIKQYQPEVYPQGSFLLGTVIRPLSDSDEYDVDLVCRLTATKEHFTQKSLKEKVGNEVKAYVKAHNVKKPVQEGRRCWTIDYASSAQFHMDILPAIPDVEGFKAFLQQRGHVLMASRGAITENAIAITDKTEPNYEHFSDDWPQSNPLGYAEWFRNRMHLQLIEAKTIFASKQMVTASVDDIPDYKVKTPLQRSIQLLKRHRDWVFRDDQDNKPISIIISTLAAHAYENETTIVQAMARILTQMDAFIEDRGGVSWIENPVNPEENFADKWEEVPQKRRKFYEWLEMARRDFGSYIRANRFDEMPMELGKAFGRQHVESVLGTSKRDFGAELAAPAIIGSNNLDVDQNNRTNALIENTRQAGAQSKPWSNSAKNEF